MWGVSFQTQNHNRSHGPSAGRLSPDSRGDSSLAFYNGVSISKAKEICHGRTGDLCNKAVATR